MFYSIIMLLALLWLTVNPPVIQAAWTEKQKQEKTSQGQVSNCNNNPSEEKSEDNNQILQEYISEQTFCIYSLHKVKKATTILSTDIYISYHPQLISPPPEA